MNPLQNLAPLKTLNSYIWKYKWHLLAGLLFVAISNVFKVIPAQVVREAFDTLQKELNSPGGLSKSALSKVFLTFAAVIIGFALLNGLFTYLMRQTLIVMSRKIEFDLKNAIYTKLQDLSLAFYRRNNTGDLMALASEDVSRVRMYLGPAIMYVTNLFILITLVTIIMASVSITLTLTVLLPLPLLVFGIYYVNTITFNRSTGIQEQLGRITSFSQEVYSGIRVVKSFSAETPVQSKFGKEADDYRRRTLGLARVDAAFFPLIVLLIGMSSLLTLWVGGREVIAGRITAGVIAEFFIYVNLLSWPVASLGWTSSLIQRAAASQKRINALLATPIEIQDGPINSVPSGDITFNNVSFTYAHTRVKAMVDMNVTIKMGSILGIIGPTGSGKSTFAGLLMRAYDPQSGNITLNGIDISTFNLTNYRNKLAYIPQDDFLFSDTIANNILLGMDATELSEEKRKELLHEVAFAADVLDDINGFPQGFETEIGERGITLSGGQKARIAIARALASDRDVIILDDSFSAIDTATESRILSRIGERMRGKTVLLISHRVSTVKNSDQIIVIKAGHINQSGTHDQLLTAEAGHYAKLHARQLLKGKLESELVP